MKNNSVIEKIGKLIHILYPLLIGLIILISVVYFDIDYSINKYEKVLDSTITFSSIVIGFLAALLGILVSIKDSDIVKTIFDSVEKGTLKYFFYETFFLGFSVVISSGSMYVLTGYQFQVTLYFFYVWVFLTFTFFLSTFRIVTLLLSILFRTNNAKAGERPETNKVVNKEKRDQIKKSLTKEN